MKKDKDIPHRLADFYTDYKFEILDTVVMAAFSLWGIFHTSIECSVLRWVLFGVIFLSAVYSKIKHYNKQTTIREKEQEIQKLKKDINDKGAKIQEYENTIETIGKDNTALFNAFLHLFSESINIENNDRITVYKVSGDKFITIGRYSPNPKYNDFNRLEIPINEGFIAKALCDGDFFVKGLINRTGKNGNKYKDDVAKRCDISHNTLDELRMKSRFYYCKAVADYTGMNRKAVIVFESTKENRFTTKEEISSLIEKEEKRIQTFVEKCRFIPEGNIEIANSKGF